MFLQKKKKKKKRTIDGYLGDIEGINNDSRHEGGTGCGKSSFLYPQLRIGIGIGMRW